MAKGNKKGGNKAGAQKYKKGDELNVFELVQDQDTHRRSNLTTNLDRREEVGKRDGDGDSDEERLRNIKIDHLKEGVVNDSDDEEIDSDDAFEEEDEDKYQDWQFTGSKNPNKGKNGEDEEDEEGMVDLDTMLDDDAPMDEQITKSDVDDSEIEYEEDSENEQGDSDKLTALVDSLDPSSSKPARDDSAADKDGVVAGKSSEFRVPTGAPVSLDSLLAPLPTGIASNIDSQVKPLKPSESKTAKRGALAAPLATFYKERADRQAGQKVVKDDIKQWDATMKALENSNTLSFPLQGPGQGGVEDGSKSGHDLVSDFKPGNALESSVDELLKTNNLATQVTSSDNLPQQQQSKLSQEQTKAKLQALRQQRQLMYESEKKAARMNKIKSKTYRRLRRKEKEANKRKAAEAGVLDSDEERMDAERQRALERATLRHKGGNSKWAKEMKDRSDGDRDTLNELHRMEQLGQRIRGEKLDDESDDESDDSIGDNEDDDAVKLAALNKLKTLQQKDDNTAEEKFKGIAGMKFMRDAAARENKALEDEADDFERELRGEEDESDDRVNIGGNPGRVVVAPGRAPKPATEDADVDDVPASATSSRTLGREKDDDSKPVSFDQFKEQYEKDNGVSDDEDESNPWLRGSSEGTKRAKKKNMATLSKDSKKVDKSQAEFKKRKRAAQGGNDDDDVNIDLDATITKEAKNANANKSSKKQKRKTEKNAQDGFASESDSDEDMAGGGVQAFKQRDLVAEAFAADDVVQDFADEKRMEVEAEAPQDVDTSLPGWGSWSGKGVKKNKAAEEKKRARFTKKTAGVDADQRKDAKKAHVIISEKSEKRPMDKYSVKDIPHPFTSRWQYEAAMSNALGQEFNTTSAHKRQIAPKIQVKPGQIINPIVRK